MNGTGNVGNSLAQLLGSGLSPLNALWVSFLAFIPQLITAVVVFLLGWLVAWLLGALCRKLVAATGVDEAMDRSGITAQLRIDTNSRYSRLSNVVGSFVMWLILLATLGFSCSIVGLTPVSEFIAAIIGYIPSVVIAVVILGIGLVASRFVSDLIVAGLDVSKIQMGNKPLIAATARYAIIVFAVMAALIELRIVPQLIEIGFAGLVFALALAFGLGARDYAHDLIASMRREAEKPQPR